MEGAVMNFRRFLMWSLIFAGILAYKNHLDDTGQSEARDVQYISKPSR